MNQSQSTDELLESLQRDTFQYFIHEANSLNGLIVDKTQEGSPASIAAVGLALSAYPVAVERGFVTRDDAIARTLATLRFFDESEQSDDPDATGYKGFYYHFLDMESGCRAWKSELSTVDSAFLIAGMLVAGAYFDHATEDESEIRSLSEKLYRRVDWKWAMNGGPTVTHGWKPEGGFLPYTWQGYDEALFLYILGLGSPTHPLPRHCYTAWCSTYGWRTIGEHSYLHSGPLFTHQISHLWIDFRNIRDAFMRGKSIDYFENSRRATYAQRQYAIDNPQHFAGYDANCWGITATDGPGPTKKLIDHHWRHFFGYNARGIPDGPDDGSIAPWAVVASLPFAPEIVLPALQYFESINLRTPNPYGFKATFNATIAETRDATKPWISPFHYGLNQGPVVLMIENYRSGLIWRLMRSCPYIVEGLKRASFNGGWLGDGEKEDGQ